MRRQITIPSPIIPIHRGTKKPFQIVDPDAHEDEQVFNKEGQQIGPTRDDEPWTMRRFLDQFVFVDPKWSDAKSSKKKLYAWRAIAKALDCLENAEASQVGCFEVPEETWERMRDVVEAWGINDDPETDKKKGRPVYMWNDLLMGQLLPFLEAILDAKQVKEE